MVAIFSDAIDFGTRTHVVRLVSRGDATAGAALRFLAGRSLLALPASVLWLAVAFVVHRQILVLGLALIFAPANLFLSALSRALGLSRLGATMLIVEKGGIAVALGASWMLPPVTAYCIGYVFGLVLSSLGLITIVYRTGISGANDVLRLKDTYQRARHLGMSTVATDMGLAEVPLVGIILGASGAGAFGLGARFAAPLTLPAQLLCTAELPRLAIHKGAPSTGWDALMRYRHLLAAMLVVQLGFAFTARMWAELLIGSGENWQTVTLVIRLASIGAALSSLSQFGTTFLQSQDDDRFCSRVFVVFVLLGLLATATLAHYEGAGGAAFGNLMSQTGVALLLTLRVIRLLRRHG